MYKSFIPHSSLRNDHAAGWQVHVSQPLTQPASLRIERQGGGGDCNSSTSKRGTSCAHMLCVHRLPLRGVKIKSPAFALPSRRFAALARDQVVHECKAYVFHQHLCNSGQHESWQDGDWALFGAGHAGRATAPPVDATCWVTGGDQAGLALPTHQCARGASSKQAHTPSDPTPLTLQ